MVELLTPKELRGAKTYSTKEELAADFNRIALAIPPGYPHYVILTMDRDSVKIERTGFLWQERRIVFLCQPTKDFFDDIYALDYKVDFKDGPTPKTIDVKVSW